MNSIYLIVKRALVIVYNFCLSFLLVKLTLKLFSMRKIIAKTIFMLMSTNEKISIKNQNFFSLSSIKKEAITIPKISSLLPSIF